MRSSGACERFWQMFAKLFVVRQPTITKGIFIALCISVISLISLSYYVSSFHNNVSSRTPPEPTVKCRYDSELVRRLNSGQVNDHRSAASVRIDSKVLVIVETPYTSHSQDIVHILEANRIRYKIELAGKSLPYLTHSDKGKFGVVVFERLESYLNMDQWNRQLLEKYCREYNVGIIAFAHPDQQLVNAQVKGFPLYVHSDLTLKHFSVNPHSPVLRITRAGETVTSSEHADHWTVFSANHSTYEPLSYAKLDTSNPVTVPGVDVTGVQFVTAIQDSGTYDGIQRVIFGYGLHFWLHMLLFLDSISYLSHGKLSVPLERHLLVDIDDIFVGKPGIRMTPEDVQALLSAQTRLRETVPGFTFNLGFSGKYFHRGTEDENRGDDMLVASADQFWWFPHMLSHLQPHKFDNLTHLVADMETNKQFAQSHHIPVNQSYAVAPHHSGVYPVHEELYGAWRSVWGVKVTSTEEYPHLKHARHRRGFVYRGIQVLPRQTCGLFTHTILQDKYPGGPDKLDHSIRGGELFATFVFNPTLIFMTHLSNYGNDRLALYTFESVIKFTQCWTNLKIKTVPPKEMAKIYFEMFPKEVDPIWRNPCDDKRHLAIWSEKKNCQQLPDFLVIGPQKTGTTALYSFLSMHPRVHSNVNSVTTFEEVQFFNGRNYYKGLDWYMQFFPLPPNVTKPVLFEKSANYFDAESAPHRAYALLPRAKLVCILISPARRAYSWYQHQRAHDDEVALQYTFYEVVTATEESPRNLRELRNRCLNPSNFAQHLERWLDYYPAKQLLILDGEQLRIDPITTMDTVQGFLDIEPYLDYSTKLKYNTRKGFFCQVVHGNHTKCLGRSKGRQYPPMDQQSQTHLQQHFYKSNVALSKLLNKLSHATPDWLQEELSDGKKKKSDWAGDNET